MALKPLSEKDSQRFQFESSNWNQLGDVLPNSLGDEGLNSQLTLVDFLISPRTCVSKLEISGRKKIRR